jgi:hypothetical protein
VQLVTTVLKILPLFAVLTVGLFYLNPDHFTPFNNSGESNFSAITACAALTLWAYLGLESEPLSPVWALGHCRIRARDRLLGISAAHARITGL